MTELNTIKCYAQAYKYVLDGMSVIPCGKNKRPLLNSWREFQKRQPTETELKQWWTRWPDALIGLVTGEISKIIVIDVDLYAGAKDIFPETFTVRTGNGGLQKYFKYTPGFTISANSYKDMPHVDIRSTGGYVIAWPSITDYIDEKTGEKKGGEYTIIDNREYEDFPVNLFPKIKEKRKLSSLIGISTGGRNDGIASFIGKLLHAEKDEKEWPTEVWSAVVHLNKTFTPPLSEQELKNTFDSIVKKELEHRKSLIVSPFQTEEGDNFSIPLRKASNGIAYRDMANVVAVLEHHPYYKGTIKFNTFAQEIEYHGKSLEDSDINKIQYFMQTAIGLSNLSKDAVFSAIIHVAQKFSYDEAQDWLKSLEWDNVPRLTNWLSEATGVPDDAYHRGIGSNWFMGIIKRIMIPGCIFDYILVTTGAQGIGKTSMFRIIGGPWYKSFTGSVENKDFYLALRKVIVLDLDEGATLYKAEAIKIKSIITQTEDEFRAPYDRVMKKYPRRFVFSMSTNDAEPFRDATGNRRYWALDLPNQMVNFKWLEENRDQLFAETYYYFKNKMEIPIVPEDEAREVQEAHLPDDSWTQLVVDEVKQSAAYCEGDPNYSTTVLEVFSKIFPQESLVRLDKRHEMRIGTIFRKQLGLEKRREMVEGERKNRFYITEKKAKELQAKNAVKTVKEIDEF